MDFINATVDLHGLPTAEDVPLKPIERSYLTVIRIELAISLLVLLAIAVILIVTIKPLQRPVWIYSLGAAWVFLAVIYFIFQTRSFNKKAYALRDKDVIYRSGWIVQTIHTCPFNRIQHSSVTTGFFERKYGLATLIFYTAGTNEADLRIPGLKAPDAYAIKEWITKKVIHEDQPPT